MISTECGSSNAKSIPRTISEPMACRRGLSVKTDRKEKSPEGNGGKTTCACCEEHWFLKRTKTPSPDRLRRAYPSHSLLFGCRQDPSGKNPWFRGTADLNSLNQSIFVRYQ